VSLGLGASESVGVSGAGGVLGVVVGAGVGVGGVGRGALPSTLPFTFPFTGVVHIPSPYDWRFLTKFEFSLRFFKSIATKFFSSSER